MPHQASGWKMDEFLAVYTALTERFKHDENACALFNEVAVELLLSLRRRRDAASGIELDGMAADRVLDEQPALIGTAGDGLNVDGPRVRRYYLWLLGRKGFQFRHGYWRDVDRSQRQCARQRVVHLPLEDYDLAAGPGFSHDPRGTITYDILLDQALGILAPREQALFIGRVIEGQTLQELADRLRITPQGVKKRLDRIYTRVRAHLAKDAA